MSSNLTYNRPTSTLPPELLQGASVREASDSGPFYAWSPGNQAHRLDDRDSTPHIFPCVITMITDFGHWKHIDISAPGATNPKPVRNEKGIVEEHRLNSIPASDTLGLIMDSYSIQGFVHLRSLDHLRPIEFDMESLNKLLRPYQCDWEFLKDTYVERVGDNEELRSIIDRDGALAARQWMVRNAKESLRKSTNPYRDLYMTTISEIESSFQMFKSYAENELKISDDLIQRHRNGGVGKPSYDFRDEYFIWLTRHERQDGGLKQSIIVNTPAQAVAAPAADIERKECSECGEMISVKARLCRFCGTKFMNGASSTLPAAEPETDPLKVAEGIKAKRTQK